MLDFLKRLFASTGSNHPVVDAPQPWSRESRRERPSTASNQPVVDAYWCESSIKLPAKVQTPGGSNITVVNACVDIYFSVDHDNIVLQGVHLSRGGGRISGSNTAINVASDRTGEAWFASNICSESQLAEAVKKDLSASDSRLRRIMMGKWRDLNRNALVQSLADALNTQASPRGGFKTYNTQLAWSKNPAIFAILPSFSIVLKLPLMKLVN